LLHTGFRVLVVKALLKNFEASIQGTIRLMFQPAEEGGAGGKRMVEEGVVDLSPPAQHA
jgi:IAA-amino acid hydrolase